MRKTHHLCDLGKGFIQVAESSNCIKKKIIRLPQKKNPKTKQIKTTLAHPKTPLRKGTASLGLGEPLAKPM